MLDVALCIATEHDSWLVLLAVFVCCAGTASLVHIFDRTRSVSRAQGIGWSFLAAISAGATIWCTHFVAMLAFEPPVPVRLEPVPTIGSLVVAVVGSFLGLLLAARQHRWLAVAGGVLFGAAIATMHFVGMTAYRVDGIVSWNQAYVVAAVLSACLCGGVALPILTGRERPYRLLIATVLIVLGIAALHFTAMAAMDIVPLQLSGNVVLGEDWRALALATALVGLLIIAAGIFATLIDRQNRSEALLELRHMALSDNLTGLVNRAGFHAEFERRIAAARISGERLALCAIDLCRFKEVNDIYGHQAGDEVLRILGDRLRRAAGPLGIVGRLGGDEFVALIPYDSVAELTSVAETIQATLSQPVPVAGFEAQLGASVGVATFPHDAGTGEQLLNNADLAMFRAKCAGSITPCHYDGDLDQATRAKRELANDLRQAIVDESLEVHYQVQAKVGCGQITGYEALLRWTHPVRGPIPPSTFISIAEENGLILPLGEWVLRRACSDAAKWEHGAKVAVNVSALQLAHADLPRLFHEVLLETGLPPSRLEVELTETAIISDRERALHVLRGIKALGIGVALDDFGTGYSSLETLRAFPFDKIKLDRFFVSELATPQAIAIIRAVLALGKSLSIPILAEGIENRDQLDLLIREGCDEMQGFLIGRPMPLSTIDADEGLRTAA